MSVLLLRYHALLAYCKRDLICKKIPDSWYLNSEYLTAGADLGIFIWMVQSKGQANLG